MIKFQCYRKLLSNFLLLSFTTFRSQHLDQGIDPPCIATVVDMLQSCHPRASLAWNCFSAVVGTGKRSQRLWCILRDHNNLQDHMIRRTVRRPSFRFQQFLSVMNYCPASVVWAHIMHFPTPRSTYQLRAIPAMWMDHNLYWAHAF